MVGGVVEPCACTTSVTYLFLAAGPVLGLRRGFAFAGVVSVVVVVVALFFRCVGIFPAAFILIFLVLSLLLLLLLLL